MSMHCDLTAVAMKYLSNLDLSICDFYCCYVIKFVVNVVCALMIVSEGNTFMLWINDCQILPCSKPHSVLPSYIIKLIFQLQSLTMPMRTGLNLAAKKWAQP